MPDVRLMDGEALVLGVEYPVALKKNTADSDARVAMIDLPVGGAVSVPVVAVGVRLDNRNLGMFDGLTQPMVAIIDLDHDSYVGFHFSADDTPVIRMRAGGSGTVRNHTIPDVASDTFVLLAATQTLTNKTLTAPTIADFTNAGHDHGDADDGGALASGIALTSPALTTPTITTSVVLTRTALGTSPNIGFHAQNTTAAAAGAQQVSPAVRWSGQGWKTDAAAASQAVEFQAYVVPVQGAANPSGYLTWEYAINGGAYAEAMRLTSAGVLHVQNTLTFDNPGTVNVAAVSGTNVSGNDITFAAGAGTGNAQPGDIFFNLGGYLASGATVQTVERAALLRMQQSGGNNSTVLYLGRASVDYTSATGQLYPSIVYGMNATVSYTDVSYARMDIGGSTVLTVSVLGSQTGRFTGLEIDDLTVSQSGGAITVATLTGVDLRIPSVSTSVTATDTYGLTFIPSLIQTGTFTRITALYIPAITWAATNGNYQIGLATGSSGTPAAVTDRVSMTALDFAANDARLYVQGEAGMAVIIGNNAIFIGDTANANMTAGLTINMGASDLECGALKSSDVAHGITNVTETDTFATFRKVFDAAGGLAIRGFDGANAHSAIFLRGTGGIAADTTKTIGGYGVMRLGADVKNGTTIAAVGANGNLVSIDTDGTTRFIFDTEGSAHADVEWITFDVHQDVLLMEDMEVEMTGRFRRITPERYGVNSLAYSRSQMEGLRIVGADSWHEEKGHLRQMVNFSRLAMLHHGAILQVADDVLTTKFRLDQDEGEIARLKARVAKLEARLAA